MDDKRVADYFVVAGLPEELEPVDDISKDGYHLKWYHTKPPITDIAIVFSSLGETCPKDFEMIEETPTGLSADLNHGSLRSPKVFLCYRRGRDRPPLVDVGVMYEGKERILPDSEILEKSTGGRVANVNNSVAKTFLTYRRAPPSMPCNALVVTEIVVICTSKGEMPPHAFCMISKNLNKGLVGADIFICYKKSMNRPNLITYKPGTLSRYPHHDQDSFPLPPSVPLFCLPMGATLEAWPSTARQPDPVFSTFVLTVSDAAQKVYGSAVTFYERVPPDKLTEEQLHKLNPEGDTVTYNMNKCICLLSCWPFFDTFEKFLLFLYRMSCEGSHAVPIERYISHLLQEVPFPSVQRPRILLQLSPEDLLMFTQPEDLPLPRSGAGFRQLLMNLGPDNCLMLLLCVLTEQKLLIHSLRPDVLTAVAEAASMIIFPFKWQCPYIPLCPISLVELLHAPLPFLIGVDSRFFDLSEPPRDVVCVDLDTNIITLGEAKYNLHMSFLPKKPARMLRNSLAKLHDKLHLLLQSGISSANTIDLDFQMKRKELNFEVEIQEAFLRFMATILKGYRSYLLPIIKAPTVGTTDTNSLFNLKAFTLSRDKSDNKFFALIVKTQMFIRFIEERSFVSDMDAGLAFFDDCTEKLAVARAKTKHLFQDGEVRLLDMDESHHSERTVFIMPPEPAGLPVDNTYTYEGFSLNPLLFSHKEPKSLLKAASARGGEGGLAPGSPMARRTKHEIKSAQKLARKYASSPELWAKLLLGTCYSIWFIHLPSQVLASQGRAAATLRSAQELLVRLHKAGFTIRDEVCYRVMMQLCGVYSQPVLAVKLLFLMKRSGLQPNAITYGFYNRAVLESTWPSDMHNNSQLLWNKLRNVVMGAALFRQAGRRCAKHRRLSTATEDGNSLTAEAVDGVSHTSIDSATSHDPQPTGSQSDTGYVSSGGEVKESGQTDTVEPGHESDDDSGPNSLDFAAFDRYRTRHGSIVRPSGLPLWNPTSAIKQQGFESSAGVLMASGGAVVEEGGEEELRPRLRSGSFSESTPRQPHPPLKHTPTSPKPEADCFKLLTRSESFANDAGILAKLQVMRQQDSVLERNGRLPHTGNRLSQPTTVSKSLFRRRGSLNLRRLKESTETGSCDSSTENLGGSSTDGTGSCDDLAQTKRSKILSSLSNKMNKIGSDMWTRREVKPRGKSSSESLNKSPIKSPSRTPVTENDPLGALMSEVEEIEKRTEETHKTVSRVGSEIELDQSGAPVLFDRRKTEWGGVKRSATFHDQGDEESDDEDSRNTESRPRGNGRKSMQRSSTMPIDDNPTQSPLSALGSTFKLPFARYSPSRFSLRNKAAELRLNTQIIEDAITNFSPSHLTSKKSNELLLGGLHSLKTAANSMAKKFDEIKEAISANSTPVKTSSLLSVDTDEGEDEQLPRRKISSETVTQHLDSWSYNLLDLFGDGSRKGSVSNLQPLGETNNSWWSQLYLLNEKLYPRLARDPELPLALDISMTTCCKCHNCGSVLYDEEIMAGWSPDDSNLNTKCVFCDKETVPFLNVTGLDYRNCSIMVCKTSVESLDKSVTGEPVAVEPITVPYLNPLVLRKELESILHTEGDVCLTQPKFVDEHPIIYWNMVWVFERLGVESHLRALCLHAASVLQQRQESQLHQSWVSADHSNVTVKTLWDNPRLYDEIGQPMYVLWSQDNQQSSLVSALITDRTTISRSVMEQIISSVRCNDLVDPLKRLATERQKLKGRHSLYRDILYLAFNVLGRENIDQSAFDREYVMAYETVETCCDSKLFQRCDVPPSQSVLFCRHVFRELQL
ncbi:DENN domain-containing protein Crag [Macrosteles quadrilineatus]|uniref:DENN domain-containing protein Crag n=1 Tax=Macrosteles quadrilineatus TaxID=74068 RepID=UPI0023E2A9CB|nr:DENN domain-containing protein Crag [Macrosteles quadrilineatus]